MATKTRRIVITLPERMLKDVDWLAPLEDLTRDQLITEAVKRFLNPHLEIRAQVLKAAAKPGKMHGPFDTVDEMIAHMKGKLKKRSAPSVSIKDHIDTIAPTPNWLRDIGDEAKRKGLNKVSMRQIDVEIAATRRERREKTTVPK